MRQTRDHASGGRCCQATDWKCHCDKLSPPLTTASGNCPRQNGTKYAIQADGCSGLDIFVPWTFVSKNASVRVVRSCEWRFTRGWSDHKTTNGFTLLSPNDNHCTATATCDYCTIQHYAAKTCTEKSSKTCPLCGGNTLYTVVLVGDIQYSRPGGAKVTKCVHHGQLLSH